MSVESEMQEKEAGVAPDGPALPSVRGAVRRPGASRWVKRGVWLALLLAAAGAAAWYREPLRTMVTGIFGTGVTAAGPQTVVVQKGTLRIAVTEDGKLRAVKNETIMLQINGKITWLAQPGEKVNKGDLLVTLEAKPFEDQRRIQTAELDAAKQALIIAQQAIPMAQSKADADVAAMETKRDETALALKLYTTLEVPKKLNELETQINDARSKLQGAKDKKTEAQRKLDEMLEEGDEKVAVQQELKLAAETVASYQKTMSNIEEQRKLFRAYSYPQDLKSKKQALANAELEVTKAKVSGKSDMMQKEAEARKSQNAVARLTEDIARLDEMVGQCRVTAPCAGLVFYGSPDMQRIGLATDRIRVGSEWYSNYPIMTIPDLSAFQIDVPVPEVYRGRLALGQLAQVSIEAVPGLVLEGSIQTLANVARNRVEWDSTSPQIFDVSIRLDKGDPRMVVGMSGRVEITTAVLEEVLKVPIEAVFNEEGKTVAFVAREGKPAEKAPVRIGQANDHFVVIEDGLREGDHVLLARPDTFTTPGDFVARAEAMGAVAKGRGAATASGPATTSARASNAQEAAATSEAVAATTSAAATTRAAATMSVAVTTATAPATTSASGTVSTAPAGTEPAASMPGK
jgi:HlyD family secretion protein